MERCTWSHCADSLASKNPSQTMQVSRAPSTKCSASLSAFRNCFLYLSMYRQNASVSIYSPIHGLQLHHFKRKYFCWQSAVPLPSAQVKLRQLALSSSTLYVYKGHCIRMEQVVEHTQQLIVDYGKRHAKRAILVQKSVEAMDIRLNALD